MEANYNLNQVLPLGVLTGSRAFNCATEESDWDIVLLESNIPDYLNAIVVSYTDFINDPLDQNYTNSKPGFDLSEYAEFEDESFIEYDQHTIWGPLIQIVKYYDDYDNCINLFVYENNYAIILDKFKELNNLMNFVYGSILHNRSDRVNAFIKVIKQVGITDA